MYDDEIESAFVSQMLDSMREYGFNPEFGFPDE